MRRTAGGIAITTYVAIILAIGFLAIPGEDSTLHYVAARYLPPNTRLSEVLLSAPEPRTLGDRNRISRELDQLSGKYIVEEVKKWGKVKSTNTAAWPSLTDQDLASVEIAGEPDWMLLNSGTKVDVWDTNSWKGASCVLAIVSSDQALPSSHVTAPSMTQPGAGQNSAPARKWLVLLNRSDLGHDGLAVRDGLALRIRKFPEAAAEPRCVGEAAPNANQASTGSAAAATPPSQNTHSPDQK